MTMVARTTGGLMLTYSALYTAHFIFDTLYDAQLTGSESSTGMPHTTIRIWSRFARPSATALRPTPETWPLCWWINWMCLPAGSARATPTIGTSTGMRTPMVVRWSRSTRTAAETRRSPACVATSPPVSMLNRRASMLTTIAPTSASRMGRSSTCRWRSRGTGTPSCGVRCATS